MFDMYVELQKMTHCMKQHEKMTIAKKNHNNKIINKTDCDFMQKFNTLQKGKSMSLRDAIKFFQSGSLVTHRNFYTLIIEGRLAKREIRHGKQTWFMYEVI